jgi:hypothetical protein
MTPTLISNTRWLEYNNSKWVFLPWSEINTSHHGNSRSIHDTIPELLEKKKEKERKKKHSLKYTQLF